MKTPRLYTRSIMRGSTLRRTSFLDTIRKNEKVLDEKYFETVAKQRSSIISALWKSYTIQVPIFAFLVLSLIPIEASFSVFGVSPTSNKNLREVLVVLSALIGVAIAFMGYYRDALSDILIAYAERKSKGNGEVEQLLKVAYGLDTFPLPPRYQGYIELGWGFFAFIVLLAILIVALVAVVAAAALYIHIQVLMDIYHKPSFSSEVSIAVICFVLACDLITFIIAMMNGGPILTRNFTNMIKVGKMDGRKADEFYAQVVQEHYQKPLFVRLFTRLKMPRKLP